MTAAASERTAHPDTQEPHNWIRPTIGLFMVIGGIIVLAILIDRAIENYRDRMVIGGLGGKPSPVSLTVAGEPMTIPANMIRFRADRRGGPVDSIDLLLHWPGLEGFSKAIADDFKDTSPDAPLIYVSIGQRTSPLDASARLDPVYSRFFTGPPIPGPDGLIGRALTADSGYGGEVVYFVPNGPSPFVARCLAEETADLPATCIRDVNVGRSLSILYRFNKARLADWRALDAGLQALARRFLDAP